MGFLQYRTLMFLEIISRQLEQNHRASGAFINNDNIEENRCKKKTDRKHRKHTRDKKRFEKGKV